MMAVSLFLPIPFLDCDMTVRFYVGHVFAVNVGSGFTVPTASTLPTATAHNLEVLDHALNVVYSTPFDPLTWHNFAIQVSLCDQDQDSLIIVFVQRSIGTPAPLGYLLPKALQPSRRFQSSCPTTARSLGQLARATSILVFSRCVHPPGCSVASSTHPRCLFQLPLADPKDTAAQQGDVVHRGIQEGTTEGLYYSGVFVESASGGISAGYGGVVPAF